MTHATFFKNNVETKLIKSSITMEGDRAVDQGSVELPANIDAAIHDSVNYCHDIIDMNKLKVYLGFENNISDESGQNNNGYGSVKIPINISKFDFENNTADTGDTPPTTITTNGTFTFIAGKVGTYASVFDGTTNWVTLSNKENYDFERTDPISISLWVKTSAVVLQGLVTKKTSSGTAGWDFRQKSTGKAQFVLYSGTNTLDVESTASINDNAWHQVVVTYDGTSDTTGVKFYIDNVVSATVTTTNTLAASILNAIAVNIGAYNDASNKFTGNMDNCYIFRKTLTAEQVTALYHEGTLKFSTGEFSGQTLNLDATYSIKLQNEPPFDFDFNTPFSVAFFINPDVSGSGNVYCVSKGLNTSNAGWYVWYDNTNQRINFYLVNATPTAYTVTSTINGLVKGVWNHVVCTYDGLSDRSGLKIYVNGVLDATGAALSTTGSALNNVSVFIGSNGTPTSYLNGKIDGVRIIGRVLSVTEIVILGTKRPPLQIMWLGGNITKINKKSISKEIILESVGAGLGNIEVRGEVYQSRTPEYIVENIIRRFTDFRFFSFGSSSGLTITTYVADGKVIDIVRDLAAVMNKAFHVTPWGDFHLEENQIEASGITLEQGKNSIINENTSDDTEIINELTVIGSNVRYDQTQTIVAIAAQKIFTLTDPPTSVRVEYPPGTQKTPEIDYTFDTLTRTVTTTVAPGAGVSVKIEYEFEKPLIIKGTKPSSIAANGLHAKRLVASWIKNRQDGVRFVQGYLGKYKDIKTKIKAEIPTLITTLDINKTVIVKNTLKNINSAYVIKSLTFNYPEGRTVANLGEYSFNQLEFDKMTTEKIHDLEHAISQVKELSDYKSPEEILALTDTVALSLQESPVETLVLVDVTDSRETYPATYNADVISKTSFLAHLDMGNTPNDQFSTNHGTITGTAVYAAVTHVVKGRTGDFAAGSFINRVDLANENTFDIAPATPISVSFWMKSSATGTVKSLITKKSTVASVIAGWAISTTAANAILFEIADGTTSHSVTSSQTTLCNSLWHLVTCTYDGTSQKTGMHIYVDGTVTNGGSAVISGTLSNAINVRMGQDGSGTTQFTGQLDELRIYGRSISSSEVTDLVNNIKGTQYSTKAIYSF